MVGGGRWWGGVKANISILLRCKTQLNNIYFIVYLIPRATNKQVVLAVSENNWLL